MRHPIVGFGGDFFGLVWFGLVWFGFGAENQHKVYKVP
jgi:hypothetical protein